MGRPKLADPKSAKKAFRIKPELFERMKLVAGADGPYASFNFSAFVQKAIEEKVEKLERKKR